MRIVRVLCLCLVVAGLPRALQSHTGSHASVHDTVAGVIDRLKRTLEPRAFHELTRERAEQLLTPVEREILGTSHLSFTVDRPVRVTVFHDQTLGNDPFWLRDGWQKLVTTNRVADVNFDLWERDFPAGVVGLGVNALKGGGRHYFVTVTPLGSGAVYLDDLYPGQLRTSDFKEGALPWADRTEELKTIPAGYAGQTLIRTLHERRDDAKLIGRFRWTRHPSTLRPDHVVLTWNGDPRTTQAIQWRSAWQAARGLVEYAEAPPEFGTTESGGANVTAPPPSAWRRVNAFTTTLISESTINDPVVRRHTVTLAGLKPGTTYFYRVGTGVASGWSEMLTFTTAPARPEPFSFIYMGDAQNGLDTWGKLVRGAAKARPDVAFYLMAGDLVDRGNERDDWDDFFHNARGVFDRRQLVPVIGNHECQGGHPSLYLGQFALPRNGPAALEPERVYSLEYGGALFLILDSNLPPESQTEWMEERLSRSQARWKFVAYHHPAYSSAVQRDNKKLRETWTPIFDRYGVDLALQGHDHAYLRTHPLRGNRPAGSMEEGTSYIVSYSGTKGYKQDKSAPTTAIGFTDIPTWQVLDLQIDNDRLRYRAYDKDGRVRDEFVIDKSGMPPARAGSQSTRR